ncbi:neprilysin-1-like [Rhipicephalus microplus]|uniref:neprilysin-1-like n=1 Tax=Rhipicephalus microplus TaxID=6941 RepID=UPI003F6CA907
MAEALERAQHERLSTFQTSRHIPRKLAYSPAEVDDKMKRVLCGIRDRKPYPDAPLDLDALFPTWIKALGLSSQYMWIDTTTLLYDETAIGLYYDSDVNRITVPTASMLRPFMYMYGVPAVNYGGLGTNDGAGSDAWREAFVAAWERYAGLFGTWQLARAVVSRLGPRCTVSDLPGTLVMIGQALMGALDPRGIHSLNGYVPDPRDEVMREYRKRALCLRKSRRSVLSVSGTEETLSEELDSENLADFVGTKMAFDAFEYLVSEQRDQNLAGLNMSVRQLFFIRHCARWCSEDNSVNPPHAPPRVRCMVPLMNMRPFSSAFGCAAKTAMNPKEKCTFW